MNSSDQMPETATRRGLIKGLAGAGLLWAAGQSARGEDRTSPSRESARSDRRIPRMRITRVDPILTGSDVFVRIETDTGIVGYGDATNHFLPYSVEGMLRDLIPYLIGEDPQRIEYLRQVCFRRRF